MVSADAPYSPTNTEILTLATEIREQSPSLGLPKVLSAIKSQQLTWQLSEKRLKKLLQAPKVFVSSSTATSRPTPNLIVPESLVVKTSLSGKGLYATRPMASGETIFKEFPFVWVPSIDVLRSGQCAYCGKTFGAMGHTLRVHCKECTQVWCTKTCAKKDESHSSENKFITCPGRNKDWNAFLEYVTREERWLGGLAVGHLWVKIVCSAHEGNDLPSTSIFAETLESFSTISQEKRHEGLPSWMFEEETIRGMWMKAFKLLVDAILCHPSYVNVSRFLTFPQFLLHLGMFNTNNLNGGLYPLHSHINHSCAPNVKAIDIRGRLAELSVIATEDIPKGEEITLSYVNPEWPGELRRESLKRDYGFECHCKKCLVEIGNNNKTGND